MENKEADAFIDAINTVVNADGAWQDKMQLILSRMSDLDRTNLDEILSWDWEPTDTN